MKRVLIIKLWALGDLLMATPLVPALQAQFPGVEVSWLADLLNADLLEGQPGIDVVRIDSGFWRRRLRKGQVSGWLQEARFWQRTLKGKYFDVVINCHADLWWTRILCQAPVRVGLFHTEKPSILRRFYTHAVAKTAGHNTDYYLEGVKALGLRGPLDRHMKYEVLPGAAAEAAAFLAASDRYDPSLPLVVRTRRGCGRRRPPIPPAGGGGGATPARARSRSRGCRNTLPRLPPGSRRASMSC